MIDCKKTGRNIQKRMDHLNINARQLGKEIDVSPQQIGYWIIGRNFPSVENYLKLCLALGVGPFELLEGENL